MTPLSEQELVWMSNAGKYAGPNPGSVVGLMNRAAAEIRSLRQQLAEAQQVAADRASADPAVRDLLLYEFGTTEPELLKEAITNLRDKLAAHSERQRRLDAAMRSILNQCQGAHNNCAALRHDIEDIAVRAIHVAPAAPETSVPIRDPKATLEYIAELRAALAAAERRASEAEEDAERLAVELARLRELDSQLWVSAESALAQHAKRIAGHRLAGEKQT